MTLIDKACWERGCACYDDRVDEGAVKVVLAQRTWVGLTNKERYHVTQTVNYSPLAMTHSEWVDAVQIETEAKLKEKNT